MSRVINPTSNGGPSTLKNYSRIRLNGITIFIFNKNLTEEKRVYRRRKPNESKVELPLETQIENENSVQIDSDTKLDDKEEITKMPKMLPQTIFH